MKWVKANPKKPPVGKLFERLHIQFAGHSAIIECNLDGTWSYSNNGIKVQKWDWESIKLLIEDKKTKKLSK